MSATSQLLAADARAAVAVELQATLAELLDLALQGKQAHWNVRGPHFKSVHEMLDEQIDAQREWYDEVAERLVALGVPAAGQHDAVAKSGLAPLPAGFLGDRAVVTAIFERVDTVAKRIRERLERVGESDPVSEDMLIGILTGLEKQRWMLGAQLEG